MIDIQQVRELLELMVEHGLNEIRVKQGDTIITLRKGPTGEPIMMMSPQAAPMAMPAAMAPMAAPSAGGHAPPSGDEGLIPVPSPMVGTYYGSPDPESPPFVRVGDQIDERSVICIIEAMKVFNEIQAEVAGTVERILVHNEQAVEYGQPLLLIRPRS